MDGQVETKEGSYLRYQYQYTVVYCTLIVHFVDTISIENLSQTQCRMLYKRGKPQLGSIFRTINIVEFLKMWNVDFDNRLVLCILIEYRQINVLKSVHCLKLNWYK